MPNSECPRCSAYRHRPCSPESERNGQRMGRTNNRSRQCKALAYENRRRLDARAPWKGNAGLILTIENHCSRSKENTSAAVTNPKNPHTIERQRPPRSFFFEPAGYFQRRPMVSKTKTAKQAETSVAGSGTACPTLSPSAVPVPFELPQVCSQFEATRAISCPFTMLS